MILNRFTSVKDAEEFLETTYLNRVISLDTGDKTIAFKVDRISVDNATKANPLIIVTSNEMRRYEVDDCEFFETVTIL